MTIAIAARRQVRKAAAARAARLATIRHRVTIALCIIASVAALALPLSMAIEADAAQGLTVLQSLASWGL